MSSPPPTGAAEPEVESRDWAEMPSDALAAVFGKLDVTDLLTGAGLVCRAWRRLAATDPTPWRRVDMSHQGDIMEDDEAEAMARAAVDRAAGTMEAFWADSFVTDGLLLYISERASSLKSLQLSMCLNVSNEGIAEAMKGFPQLEELDITFCSLYGDVCASVGKACPELKCFRLNERYTFPMDYAAPGVMDDDTGALGIASNMPNLRELQLIGNKLTNDGLMSILDHCQHLESLDIRQCYSIQMDDALKSKCARIRDVKLPHDSISDFKYRAYIVSTGYSGSDLEVDMYDDLLDVVTDDDDADFDDMDDDDDACSDGAIYDDEFDI
ncbi:putative F-box/LRR-repeat protein 23 [Oryza brachyantha]|uniref:putative F-box/LRR-repeat protein 23 n=1 Tax=Oryza brachyantha TaxID=4533 RepID=UPI001ADA67AA|nr:putative F-box/LRR-repeat protein 23 [Oryza brachyantha]